MSVWESTTYKLDIVKQVYEVIPTLVHEIFGNTASPYLQPRGSLVWIQSDDSWDDVACTCSWHKGIPSDRVIDDIKNLTRNVSRWSVGLSAVYKLVQACHEKRFDVKPQYEYGRLAKQAKALSTVVTGASMVTPEAFTRLWDQVDEETLEMSRKFESFSEAWKFLARSVKGKSDEYIEIDQSKFFGYGSRIYYGGVIGQLVILVGASYYSNRGLILTRTHLNMVIESTARIAALLDHTAREYANYPVMRERILRMLSMTIVDGGKSKGPNTDKVVQAYHKARAFMQMRLFDNIMDNARTEALIEFQSKNLQTVMSLPAYMKCFTGLPKGRWLELLHVYKWMPPPDYDSTYAFSELYDHHMSTRLSGLDPRASPRMKELWALIVKERKLNIAYAWKKVNKEWPPGLEIEDGFPVEESVTKWVPRGLFPYHTYGKDITAQIKDKTTVLADMRNEVKVNERSMDKNFLLWYLKHNGEIDTRDEAEKLVYNGIKEDNYVRVAYKGEAHKPGSRLFFMAPPIHRILMGELEGNISRIAQEYPASLQGMAILKRTEKLEHLFNVGDLEFGIPSGVDFTCYVVTFDLSKFSPRFNPAVLRDLHDFWADVFSYEPIRAMAKIGAESVILHTTNNLVMHYRNKGADLEGFRGRMMTLFHADLISAACRQALADGYIVGKAVTAVFIDDGAVRIAAKGVGEEARTNALNFLKTMQDVYEAAGQENHPNKTIVSSTGGELLAEQYLHGQRLKCPIKAGMRLFPSYDTPASCLPEEFESLFSTIQGSIKDGATWVIAYRRLADAYLKAIYRWSRNVRMHMDNVQFAIKLALPKSLGGFGFPSLHSVTSTAAYDQTSEGLGILSYAAKMYPSYAELVDKILNREVVLRRPLQVLRDPGRVRMVGPILVEGRIATAILDKLAQRDGPWSAVLANYRDEDIIAHATAVAVAALSGEAISFPVLKRIWDCTPLAYVEGIVQKFKRSGSITLMLGEATITRIRNQNRRDVIRLLKDFVPVT